MTPTSTRDSPRRRGIHRGARPAALTLGPDERQALLACARATLAAATGVRAPSFLGETIEAAVGLDQPGRAFVTLTENGRLRSCMGSLDPDRAVRDSVVTAAIRAALEDPRFEPVSEDELPAIHVAVSVLGPDRPLATLADFRPGIDGLIVERGNQGALLLPEVATEFGWDGVDMLGAVCRKAGLPTSAWAERGARVLTFETVRFEGPALEACGRARPGEPATYR